MLKEEDVKIVSVNETFLSPNITVHIPGHHILRRDRTEGSRGGVALLIKNNLQYIWWCLPSTAPWNSSSKKAAHFLN